jgi:hypothetical protein
VPDSGKWLATTASFDSEQRVPRPDSALLDDCLKDGVLEVTLQRRSGRLHEDDGDHFLLRLDVHVGAVRTRPSPGTL